MDLVTVLQHAQSQDPVLRNQAVAHLDGAVEAQYGQFMLALCVEFATEGKPPLTRQLAGLYLKNLVTARDDQVLAQKLGKWTSCEPQYKDQLRAGFFQALSSPESLVSRTAAQIIGAFGSCDIPKNEWTTLVPALMNNVISEESSSSCKVASLEALGFMCEAMDPEEVNATVTNQMLSAIINGLRSDRPNEIRLAAIVALNNSLDFTSHNFEVEGERDAIMRTICEASLCTDPSVREHSFECLAKIPDLYYDKMARYIEPIFNLTTNAIRTDVPEVGLQAIEFWSAICDSEIDIMEDIESGNLDESKHLKFAQGVVGALVPFLLETMTKQEEDADPDNDWNLSMAGATCLKALAMTTKDHVVDHVLGFVTSNIQHTNWRLKDASVLAFGSILDGPSKQKLAPIISTAIPVLIASLQDPSIDVRESSCWTLGVICELHNEIISSNQELLAAMVGALGSSLEDPNPKVASKACFAVHNLAEACKDENEAPSNILSHFMGAMLQRLFVLSNRPDGDSSNLRVSAYEAVNMLVSNSALDMRSVVNHVLVETMNRLELTFAAGGVVAAKKMELQSNLCSLIGCCAERLSREEFTPHADRAMRLLLQVFVTKAPMAHEDAFMAIGNIADKLGADFVRYLAFLQPILLAGLKNIDEYEVCTLAVGLVGDICRNVKAGILPFCDDVMRSLIELLQSSTLNKVVKPHVITAFADIAMAIGGEFDRYTAIILLMLNQAGSVQIDTDDEDLIDYINSLHVSILEAYTGIIQSLRECRKQDSVFPQVEAIFNFINRIGSNENKSTEVLKCVVGLIGDIGQTYGKRARQYLQNAVVMKLLQEGNTEEDIHEIAVWAHSMVASC